MTERSLNMIVCEEKGKILFLREVSLNCEEFVKE